MWRRILGSPLSWVAAAVLILAVYLASFVEITVGDPRPLGSVEDIAALRERDDLNVLFVLIDTLRADRLGSWGYARDTSPAIDLLAASGVRFDRHLAQSSWTKCSMASLWTGLYPVRSGVLRYDHALSSEATLPAEILQQAGFRTAGLFRNGWVAANFGFAQGFETYQRPMTLPAKPGERRENPSMQHSGSDHDAVSGAIEFLRVHGDERWFLYLHLMDIHQYVYDAESALFGTSYSDIYDNSIRRLDRILESLLVHLAEEDLLDKTLIVLSSDHGEAFRERGLEGHARNVYREVTEVPFVIAFPFRLEPGIEIGVRTENVDVWPTLLDLLGLPPLEGADGQSLMPLVLAAARGEPLPPQADPAFAQLDQAWGRAQRGAAPMVAVASDGFRFVRATLGGEKEELFDRSADEIETRNVIEEHPEVAARLRSAATSYLESPPPPWGSDAPRIEIDEMELNQLRALGYAVP